MSAVTHLVRTYLYAHTSPVRPIRVAGFRCLNFSKVTLASNHTTAALRPVCPQGCAWRAMDLGYNRPTRHGVVLSLSRRNASRSFAAGVVELLIMLSVRQRVSCRVVFCDVGEG